MNSIFNSIFGRDRDDKHGNGERDNSGNRGQVDESRNQVEKLERPNEWPSPPDKDKGDD